MKNTEIKDVLNNIKKMILLKEYEKAVDYIDYVERKKMSSEESKGNSIDKYMEELISNLK